MERAVKRARREINAMTRLPLSLLLSISMVCPGIASGLGLNDAEYNPVNKVVLFDGQNNLRVQDLAWPDSLSWDTESTTNGSRTTGAVASHAADNQFTSSSPTFTVSKAVDTTAPTISGIQSTNINSGSVTITWSTNENADSQVEYGSTTSYGSQTTLNTALVTSHSLAIKGLTAHAQYHYRVKSKDAWGNSSISDDFTFTTLSIAPGEWGIISHNTIKDLDPCPLNNCTYSGLIGQRGVIDTWSGGAVSPRYGTRGGYMVFGGGDSDYLGNEVYLFDIGNGLWTRFTEPIVNPNCDMSIGQLQDGSPCARHTYDYVDYHPGTNSFVLLGSASLQNCGVCGTSHVHLLNLDTRQWHRAPNHPAINSQTGTTTAYDSIRDVFWVWPAFTSPFAKFDPNADAGIGAWTVYTTEYLEMDAASAIDPTRDLMVTVDGGGSHMVRVHELKAPENVAVTVSTVGDKTLENVSAIGFDWDPVGKRFVGCYSGSSVYTLTPPSGDWKTESWVWAKVVASATNSVIPTAPNSNGTYSRWRYVPSVDAFILVNRTTDPVFAFRMPDRLLPPDAPSGPTPTAISSRQIDLTSTGNNSRQDGFKIKRSPDNTTVNLLAQSTSANSYTTNFPLTENPISEGGAWVSGGTVGLDWNNVRTTPGKAFGTQVPGTGNYYGDSTAILAGTWAPDQTITANVYTVNQTSSVSEEVELRLRTSISAHSITGYEVNFRCINNSSVWIQIVRWNGPIGSFTVIGNASSGSSSYITNGIAIKATIVGNVITGYVNNVQVVTATDNTYTTGSPGIGFFLSGGSSNLNADFGLTSVAADEVGPPATPTNLTATAGNAQVALGWTASSGATSYNVKRSTTSGGPYTTLASPTTTSYTDTGLTNATPYFYVVSAVNTSGESANSAQASATPQAAPATPTNLTATAGNAQVALGWTASSGATSYNVKRSTTSGGPYTTLASPTTTSYTDTGLTNATPYFYVVSAVNTSGESANSAQASATPQAAPATPTNLTATAISTSQINLAWRDNANNEDGFMIERSVNGTNFTQIATVGVNVTTYSNTGLSTNTRYYYRVRGYNTVGNSAYSNIANVKTNRR